MIIKSINNCKGVLKNVDTEKSVIEQTIEVCHQGCIEEFNIIRELEFGGDITDIKALFDNLPYIKDGKKWYDLHKSIISHLFEFTEDIQQLDQYLWDTDMDTSFIFETWLPKTENSPEGTYTFIITVVSNVLIINNEEE